MKCGQCLLLLACLALAEGAQLRTDQKNAPVATRTSIPRPATVPEQQKILKPMGFEKLTDLQLLFRGVDENKDGKADYKEFKALMNKLAVDTKTAWLKTEDEKQRMFNDVDADHDKEVTFAELTKFDIAAAGYPEGYNAMTGMKMPAQPGQPGYKPQPGQPGYVAPPPVPILPAGFNAVTGVMTPGLKCVAWRRTTTCMPSGPRDPLQDKDCLTLATSQESGFCECEGMVHTAAVPCGHEPIDCTKECASMQKLHHEKFGGGDGDGSGDGCPDCAMDKVKKSGNPYHQALRYGQKAMTDVNAAVDNSNKLLGSARNMISKMMSTKPWAEVTKLGKEAEEAGRKTEMLAKLARPYIYAQVNKTID